MEPINISPALSTEQVKRIEHILGKILYYASGVDNQFLVPPSVIAKNIDPIEQDEKNVNQFFDYTATYPNAVVIFHATDMILCADINV